MIRMRLNSGNISDMCSTGLSISFDFFDPFYIFRSFHPFSLLPYLHYPMLNLIFIPFPIPKKMKGSKDKERIKSIPVGLLKISLGQLTLVTSIIVII